MIDKQKVPRKDSVISDDMDGCLDSPSTMKSLRNTYEAWCLERKISRIPFRSFLDLFKPFTGLRVWFISNRLVSYINRIMSRGSDRWFNLILALVVGTALMLISLYLQLSIKIIVINENLFPLGIQRSFKFPLTGFARAFLVALCELGLVLSNYQGPSCNDCAHALIV